MSRKNRTKKTNKNDIDVWTEEYYEEYVKGLYSLEFIAGFTEGGVPYGILLDEDNEEVRLSGVNSYFTNGEELPFN